MICDTEIEMIRLLISRATKEQRAQISLMLIGTPTQSTAPAVDQKFRVGDRVIFVGRKTKPPVIGTIKSMNEKTFTIVDCSDNGPGWRIPPHALKHYKAA